MVENSRYTNPSRKPKTGKFSKVTPGRKPKTYLGKAAPSGREQDWEQTKIFGTGELRNLPSVEERILSAFGFGKKPLSYPGSKEFERGTRTSIQHGTTEYQSERLEALDNPLVQLGFVSFRQKDPDAFMARIHEMLIPENEDDIPPEILKRLKNRNLFDKDDVKKWNGPQDMLNAVNRFGGFIRRKGYSFKEGIYEDRPEERAALEWERAASGKDPDYNINKGHQIYIRNLPEAGKKTAGKFSTFIHELAHAGSYHLKDVWEKSGRIKLKPHDRGQRWPWQDYEDTPAGKHGVSPDAHERIAGHKYKEIKGRYFASPKHLFQGEEQLAFRSVAAARKERGDELEDYERYATSPRGLSDESFRWMIAKADTEVRRLQKKQFGRVPAAYNISSKEWRSKHTPLGHLPTEHDATIAQEKDNRNRLQRIQSASQSKAPSSQEYLDERIIEATDYARATPQERIELDKIEKQRFQLNPQNIIYPNVINLPKKRRGGTVKKRYAKGGGIRKPKGF